MTRHAKFGLVVAGFFFVAAATPAQSRLASPRPVAHPGGPAGQNRLARASITAHPVVNHASATTTLHGFAPSSAQAISTPDPSVFPNGANDFIFPGATSFDLGQLLNNVPGLGFNYEFLAAMNQNLGERAFIDPATRQELALSERLSRFSTGFGAFIPFFGGYVEPVEEQEPPVDVEQQPAPTEEPESEPSAPSEELPPLPDVGEFVLVLHNGNQIKAVAFMRQNDQIVYITKDGVRSSFPAADLDAAATQQRNQQHGTPLQLSM